MNPTMPFAEHLELFLGMTNPAMAHVYARLADDTLPPDCKLSGTLTGPTCRYADTLPATFHFADLGPGDGILSRAVVPEPSYWTPELPQYYQAEISLCAGEEVVARAERLFGIRPLGARNRDLVLAGQRWVPRGVSALHVANHDLDDWHTAGAVLLVDDPGELLCAEASRAGVLLIVRLDQFDARRLTQLQCWPAVGMIVVPPHSPAPTVAVHNVLLGECFSGDQAVEPSPWADIALCEAGQGADDLARVAACNLPVVAYRSAAALDSVAHGRSLCDALQRDLAGMFPWAGYIV